MTSPRFPTVLLAASLGLNAAFLVWLAWPRSNPILTSWSELAAPRSAESPTAAPNAASPDEALGRDFGTLPPEQLRDRLRAVQLPAALIEHILRERILGRVAARERELVAAAMRTAPPWRLAVLTRDRLAILTPAERKELRDLEAAARDEILKLLEPSHLDRNGRIAAKYAFVSPGKAVLLNALDADYENLAAAAKDEARFLKTPTDQDREKLLKTEQARDLAALLTPGELEAYDLRASPTAQRAGFQSRLTAFQATEEEYRALFALQKAVDDRNPAAHNAGARPMPTVPAGTPGISMVMHTGGDAEPPADAVLAALGEKRLADWQLAGQPHYQSLLRVAATQQIPGETAHQLGLAIENALQTSWRIADDPALNGTDKKAAVIDVATKLRGELTSGLGQGTAEAYLKNARWFESLSSGAAVQVNGGMTAVRILDRPPQPAGKASPRPGG